MLTKKSPSTTFDLWSCCDLRPYRLCACGLIFSRTTLQLIVINFRIARHPNCFLKYLARKLLSKSHVQSSTRWTIFIWYISSFVSFLEIQNGKRCCDYCFYVMLKNLFCHDIQLAFIDQCFIDNFLAFLGACLRKTQPFLASLLSKRG